jgi:primosomal protein N' (replication factor Y)
MPEINMVDLKEKHTKKLMKGLFSDTLIEQMTEAFKNNEQVILFQNRRGYSPIMKCMTCGHSPQCPNCDVSLTYHKFKNELRCHYCGFHTIKPIECPACSSRELDTKGFGTEQIEQQFKELFPDQKIARMDLDTTRGKYSYEKLLDQMDTGEIQCLVGTQMVTKGLDFRNVSLVGIMNADSMLNFPDFRAHERTFQLITQVAGRAGRTSKRGKVLVQTYNPNHQILRQASMHDYSAMFKEQLSERYHFSYPPYTRMIRITFKHRDYNRTLEAAQWFVAALNKLPKGATVLGPEFPPVSRIRNQFIVNVLVKISRQLNPADVKDFMQRVNRSFEAVPNFRPVRCIMDVDFY